MGKPQTIEQRYPTKAARDKADEAIERMPETMPLTAFVDEWLTTYRRYGGIERTK